MPTLARPPDAGARPAIGGGPLKAGDEKALTQIESALGCSLADCRAVAGGDISSAFLLSTAQGERYFAKTNAGAPSDFFRAEARGLEWLRRATGLRIPEVLAVGEAETRFLVLEYLPSGPRKPDFEERLGQGLAALHRSPCSGFGLDHHNYIGTLSQFNEPCSTWVEFWVEQRLRKQVELALRSGRGPARWRERFENLYQALPEFLPEEAPSKLHGDLWGGNVLVGPQGEPCLIDPAVYGGHREVDLAMMRLFGGFGARVFDAYQEAFPLEDGSESRLPLYQLYPLLVHVNLFAGSYVNSVESALKSLP